MVRTPTRNTVTVRLQVAGKDCSLPKEVSEGLVELLQSLGGRVEEVTEATILLAFDTPTDASRWRSKAIQRGAIVDFDEPSPPASSG